jgi:nicotinate-nucleotide--dimethylbenzimidazole phosphoribosyltransferase
MPAQSQPPQSHPPQSPPPQSQPPQPPPAQSQPGWPRPRPLVGDITSSAERAADPASWALPAGTRAALADVIAARRDVRRFRPDPVPDDTLMAVLAAGHAAPSVGHSQPWRFIVVRDPAVRAAAAVMADRARLAQARRLDPDSGRHLRSLQLDGIREAPLGVVVCCDRRAAPAGVLGRATFPDTDLWSCACAIQNIWLTARGYGLGVGWVTLFEPDELAGLLGLPSGVVTLGWLCLGWPDERPPSPGLERHGWSRRLPLADVVLHDRWPATEPPPPADRLARDEAAPDRPALKGRPPLEGRPDREGHPARERHPAREDRPDREDHTDGECRPAREGHPAREDGPDREGQPDGEDRPDREDHPAREDGPDRKDPARLRPTAASSPGALASPGPASPGLLDARSVTRVQARDREDRLLAAPGSLGLLGDALIRAGTLSPATLADAGTLLIAAADHPVTRLGVSAFPADTTRLVAEALAVGQGQGTAMARAGGLNTWLADCGIDGGPVDRGPIAGWHDARPAGPRGDIADSDALGPAAVAALLDAGERAGRELATAGPVALGEVGIGNTTVAAVVAAALLRLPADIAAGRGAGSDTAIVARKRDVITRALTRAADRLPARPPARLSRGELIAVLAAIGGPEQAFLAGSCLGAADAGGLVILDGLLTSTSALLAVRHQPAVQDHLIAGQCSAEPAHRHVLDALGLEPLLDLRLRAGEGVGAVLALSLLRRAHDARLHTATTRD